jgi:hypothetical protein
MAEDKCCRGCHQLQPLDHFYRHSRMLDGHLNFCRQCVKSRVSKHRSENLLRIRLYDKERSKRPERRQQLANLYAKEAADPVRRKARIETQTALRNGKLIRPSLCSDCGNCCKPEAHHDDYTKPLDVRWLCRSCHTRHHRLQTLNL